MTDFNNFFTYQMFEETTNLYKNVLIHSGFDKENQWHSCLALTNNKIITPSNSFIKEYYQYQIWYRNFQNDNFKIFDNLYNNLLELQKNNNIHYYFDDKHYFYMLNAFSFKNSGHDMSIILDQLNYIIEHNLKNIIIYKNYKQTHNFKIIESLIPQDCVFFEIDFDKIYFIPNIIITPHIVANLYLHENLINKMIKNIHNIWFDKYNDYKNKNIILMKTNRNKNVFMKTTSHMCESFLLELEINGWINIIPEEIDIFKMIIMLGSANNIITSDGCVSFINHIFFNKNANVIYIGNNTLYISITKKNSKKYLHINDRLSDNSNKYLEYINLINQIILD